MSKHSPGIAAVRIAQDQDQRVIGACVKIR